MVLLSFIGILLFSTLLGVIAAPVDESSARTKISRHGSTTGGLKQNDKKQHEEGLSIRGPIKVELFRQYEVKQSDSQLHSQSQSDSPSGTLTPPVGEEGLLPVIHLDLPPVFEERWSLLFSAENGWCHAVYSVNGHKLGGPCPTNSQGRKNITSLPNFFVLDPIWVNRLMVPPSNPVRGVDVDYLNNIMKFTVKDCIGKVPEKWIESYEPMHEVITHGNGEWRGPTIDGKWQYHNPARGQWFTYDHAPQHVEERCSGCIGGGTSGHSAG
ncbi:hypothetical protein GGU10DRAFT_86259 [Lentinula aff. detonsa]|uniref:Uncharacterized protein n=1 Tax=Lentinula aff. detonsa TaxID=2804958 RepID=A0AA38KCN3_9AGAR|nr:hypothetical protein GGU10DRAFT_86259 [Lentinula aff. detonsa]